MTFLRSFILSLVVLFCLSSCEKKHPVLSTSPDTKNQKDEKSESNKDSSSTAQNSVDESEIQSLSEQYQSLTLLNCQELRQDNHILPWQDNDSTTIAMKPITNEDQKKIDALLEGFKKLKINNPFQSYNSELKKKTKKRSEIISKLGKILIHIEKSASLDALKAFREVLMEERNGESAKVSIVRTGQERDYHIQTFSEIALLRNALTSRESKIIPFTFSKEYQLLSSSVEDRNSLYFNANNYPRTYLNAVEHPMNRFLDINSENRSIYVDYDLDLSNFKIKPINGDDGKVYFHIKARIEVVSMIEEAKEILCNEHNSYLSKMLDEKEKSESHLEEIKSKKADYLRSLNQNWVSLFPLQIILNQNKVYKDHSVGSIDLDHPKLFAFKPLMTDGSLYFDIDGIIEEELTQELAVYSQLFFIKENHIKPQVFEEFLSSFQESLNHVVINAIRKTKSSKEN